MHRRSYLIPLGGANNLKPQSIERATSTPETIVGALHWLLVSPAGSCVVAVMFMFMRRARARAHLNSGHLSELSALGDLISARPSSERVKSRRTKSKREQVSKLAAKTEVLGTFTFRTSNVSGNLGAQFLNNPKSRRVLSTVVFVVVDSIWSNLIPIWLLMDSIHR